MQYFVNFNEEQTGEFDIWKETIAEIPSKTSSELYVK